MYADRATAEDDDRSPFGTVSVVTRTDETLAKELEADAARYPDERGEILLEAADAWDRAGNRARALEILTGLMDAGGDDGLHARTHLAEIHFKAGADDEAYAQLAALAKQPGLTDGHCELSAELLAERGDLQEAARWYDRAAARLTSEELGALQHQDGWLSLASTIMLRGRRGVRERLGLAPDMLDELVPDLPSESTPFTSENALDLMDAGVKPQKMRMLTFQRSERAEARRRWPDAHTQSDEEYYATVESNWREIREGGVPSIVVVTATVADLVEFAERTGDSPTDSAAKQRYCRTVPDENTITWPPHRNGACWCGAGNKYKKCCGRPG
jgi:tetratricopeptide (TPR) repeat protein